jgi:phosphoadenosine phosphosulfate reductase
MTSYSTKSEAIDVSNFDLDELNQRFETAHPQEILAWSAANIPSGLVQTSAFNVDDLVITDILNRLNRFL